MGNHSKHHEDHNIPLIPSGSNKPRTESNHSKTRKKMQYCPASKSQWLMKIWKAGCFLA
jgi:hypothetical protein